MSASAARASVLVVDDEPDLCTLYELTLLREGYEVETADCVARALQCLQDKRFQAVITDMRLPDGTGMAILQYLERAGRAERTVVITAYGSADNAVEALKAGAFDYLTKPVDLRQFRTVVAQAAAPRSTAQPSAARRDTAALAPGVSATSAASALAALGSGASAMDRLVGRTSAMDAVRALVDKVARSMAPVLVQGESGTGKELVARAVHAQGARAPGPFVAVNCGAIPEALLEAEFFGYRKGAFTGAAEDRAGFFQAADQGTLFLDEIGELPLSMQSKLLRVIQERMVRPVGATAEVPVNARIVSATHRDLAAEVQAGRFRQDLFYRINVIAIRVPPLRERLDDLPPIVQALLERIARDAGVDKPPTLSEAALVRLRRHDFPGNVRELENLLLRAVALSAGDVIEPFDLALPDDGPQAELPQPVLAHLGLADMAVDQQPLPSDLAAHLDAVERAILVRALEQHDHNRTAAGQAMGLSLRQMRYRMARLGIVLGETDRTGVE